MNYQDNNSNQDNNNFQNNEVKNKYEEYLPQNRFKNETGVSPKVMKVGLYIFYAMILVVSVGIGLHFYGYDVLKVESRDYNMNFSETINLDSVYMSADVIWESNSDNVVIKDNVVTAVDSGTAYIVGRVGNKQVSDLQVTVLTEEDSLHLENHSIELSTNDTHKINVIQNDSIDDNSSMNDNSSVDDNSYDSSIEEDSYSSYDDNVIDDEDDNFDDDEDLEDNIFGGNLVSDENTIKELVIDDNNNVSSSDTVTDTSNLTYESSDTSIATVDSNGNLTAISEGTVVITVTDDEGNEDHTYVTISNPDLEILNTSFSMKEGETTKINYSLNTNKYNDSDLVWSSDNNSVVNVSANGTLTAISSGTANITVKLGDVTSNTISITVEKNVVQASDLQLSVSSLSLNVGDSSQIQATISPSNVTNSSVTWTSSNTNVVSVDSNGVVKGISSGSAKIYAVTSNGIKKEVSVLVKNQVIEAQSITLSATKTSFKVGETINLSYSFNPTSTTNKTVSYSYDSKYISIDTSGLVTAKMAGTTQVTIKTANGKTSSITLTITSDSNKVNSIKIDQGNLTLKNGSSNTLTATLNPSSLTGKTIKWISSNPNVVSVDVNGKIIAKSLGTATITASCDGVSNSITVTVTNSTIDVTGIDVSTSSIELKTGKTQNITATVSPANATNKVLVYSSSNPSVATIDGSGNITATSKAGTAVITVASSSNPNIKKTINVKVTYDMDISLNKSSVSISSGNKYERLKASLKYSGSPSANDKKISWSSSNTSVATVNSSGVIVAKKAGTTTITATSAYNNKKATAKISVYYKVSLTLNKSSLNIIRENASSSSSITAKVSTSSYADSSVKWKSSDTSVVKVDKNGKVTAKGVGSAKITVTSSETKTKNGKAVSKTIPVTVTGEQSDSGSNYFSKFVSSTGKKYKNYNQFVLPKGACFITAIATSAYGNNTSVTPNTVYKSNGNSVSVKGSTITSNLKNIVYNQKGSKVSSKKSTIKSNLKNGGIAIIEFGDGYCKSANGVSWTSSTHFVALLDYNSSTGNVYVSNPAYTKLSKATRDKQQGWIDLDKLGCAQLRVVTSK